MFQKKDKNNELYIPETERFQEELEKGEKKKAEKRKSSSDSNSKIKKSKIWCKIHCFYFQILDVENLKILKWVILCFQHTQNHKSYSNATSPKKQFLAARLALNVPKSCWQRRIIKFQQIKTDFLHQNFLLRTVF